MTIAHWRALTLLQFSATPTASWVCGELHYDSGAMTRMLDKGFLLARENLNRALSDLDASQCEVLIGLLQTVKGTMLRRRRGVQTAPVDRSARKR